MAELFESQEEPSQGLEEQGEISSESSESQGGEEIPKKKQEGTIENLQSKYDKFQKQVAEERETWEREREETRNVLKQLTRQVEEIKSPPEKNEPPQKPVRPVDFDPTDMFDPTTPSGKWYVANQQYQEAKDAYRDTQIQSLMGELQQEKQFKHQQELTARQRAETIAALQEQGLPPEEAMGLYSKLQKALQSPTKEGAKLIVEMFNKPKPKPKTATEDYILPPGADGGGGIPGDKEEVEFMKGIGATKNKDIFATK